MSAPERIEERTVSVTCDCGAVFESPGFGLGAVSRALRLRCPDCEHARAASARAHAEREAAATLERRRASATLEADQERQHRAERMERAARELDVPPLYADVTLDTFAVHGTPSEQQVQRAALQFARRYADTFPAVAMTVVLQGSPGSGKGHVAWSLCRHVVRQGHTALNVKLSDLVRSLRASWGKSGDDDGDDALRRVRAADLLVIDEVSRHALYGQPVQHLYDVIDHRLDAQRPTILTSNETDGGLRALLGPALWNRIEGHGGVVDFGSASWRSRA